MTNTSELSYSISFGDALQRSKKPCSCLCILPVSERLILQPYYLSEKGSVDEKAVAKDLLTPHLFVYNKKYDGIPISHGKLKFSGDGRIQEHTGFITTFVSYQMVVFRPQANAVLTATVNKVLTKDNCIGLLAHNFFNISCILPSNQKVEIGEERQVKIIALLSHKRSLQIKAVLLARDCSTNYNKAIKEELTEAVTQLSDRESTAVTEVNQKAEISSKKRKSLDTTECEIKSEKKAKKKKTKVKTEVEDC